MDKKALILVVDDDPECRIPLVWILELHGFRAMSATGWTRYFPCGFHLWWR
jgi:hypothetical protein